MRLKLSEQHALTMALQFGESDYEIEDSTGNGNSFDSAGDVKRMQATNNRTKYSENQTTLETTIIDNNYGLDNG